MIIRKATKEDFKEILKDKDFTYFNWDFIEDACKASKTKNISVYIDYENRKYIVPLMKQKVLGFYPVAFSIAFSLFGGLVSKEEMDKKSYTHLLRQISRFIKMDIVFQDGFQEEILAKSDVIKIKKFIAQIVYTKNQDYDKYFQSDFEYKMRKNIKRAIKNDIVIRTGNTIDLIRDYYGLYELSNIRWGKKKPRRDIEFFETFVEKDYFEIRIAYFQGQPAAGLMMLKFNDYYYGWFGGMDNQLGKTRANDFLHADLIKESIEKNFAMVNFGAASNLNGVQKFKESFGAKESQYHIYFVGNPIAKAALKLMLKFY